VEGMIYNDASGMIRTNIHVHVVYSMVGLLLSPTYRHTLGTIWHVWYIAVANKAKMY
jgi:hypothetical protein